MRDRAGTADMPTYISLGFFVKHIAEILHFIKKMLKALVLDENMIFITNCPELIDNYP